MLVRTQPFRFITHRKEPLMPRIIACSDTHWTDKKLNDWSRKLPASLPGDIFIHAGDATFSGSLDELTRFLMWMEDLPYRHKVFVAGNHDLLAEKDPDLWQTF